MTYPLPPVVLRLLAACEPDSVEDAWAEFVSEYSRLILHVARAPGRSHDAVMDRYTYTLEQLRREDLRRLRGYVADGRGKFTTWLVVVVRRLCTDHERQRIGRSASALQRQRRDLADLAGVDIDLESFPPITSAGPEERVRTREVRERLAAAVAALDEPDRLLLRLRFHDNVSVVEIARLLAFPSVFHVYRRLNHLFERLRTSLHRRGLEDAAP